MPLIDISIVIVNFNTGGLLLKCVNSIVNNMLHHKYEIILVDNNSSDHSVRLIKNNFPDITVIANRENVGFAKANNQGIKIGRGRYYLLLNPDTVVLPQAIDSIISYLDANRDIGILGPKLLRSNLSSQPSVKNFPSPKGEFLQCIFLDKIIPTFITEKLSDIPVDLNKPAEADWVTGACLAIKKQVIEDIGFLDEHFFLYYEEVDFCYRAKKSGWKIFFYPQAKVIHIGGQSTEKNLSSSLIEGYKSKLYFLKKHYPPEKLIPIRDYTILGFAIRKFVWQIAYIFKIDKSTARNRIGAYRSILKIKRELNFTIDVSSAFRSKAGVGCYTRNLLNELSKLSGQSSFLIFKMSEKQNPAKKTKKRTSRARFLGALKHIFWEQVYLPFLLFARKANAFHSPAFVCPLIKTCPTIVTIHDMAYFLYPDKFVGTYRLYLKFWVPLSIRIADKIITDSICSKKDIVRLLKIPESKVEVVYLGKDSSFRPIKDTGLLEKYKKNNNLPDNFMLYVGTLEPRKNITGLLKAYRIFKNNHPVLEYDLIIAGEKGWMYSEIFSLVEELDLKDNIKFLGYIYDDDLPLLYNSSRLFVYPSLYEGFGLPPLEAMACGIPVITSNTSSLPEIVSGAGIMVNPQDANALAEAMCRVLTDKKQYQTMVENGLKRAEEFSWKNTADKTIDIYQKVLKKRNK